MIKTYENVRDCFKAIYEISNQTSSLPKAIKACHEPLESLRNFLDISPTDEECVCLAILSYLQIKDGIKITVKELGLHLGDNNLFFEFQEPKRILDQLYFKGFIEREHAHPQFGSYMKFTPGYSTKYYLNQQQLEYVLEGKLFYLLNRWKVFSLDSLLLKVKSLYQNLFDGHITGKEFQELLLSCYYQNHEFEPCQRIAQYIEHRLGRPVSFIHIQSKSNYSKALQQEVVILLLLLYFSKVHFNEVQLLSVLEQVFQHGYQEDEVIKLFLEGQHPILKDGLLVRINNPKLKGDLPYTFTPKFYQYFFDRPILTHSTSNIIQLDYSVVSHADIPFQQLYFNQTLQDSLNDIKFFLQKENFKTGKEQIKKTWQVSGGLSLLFHGNSGTGKTEFVRQLAKETQRDLYYIDLSECQSSYLGQSEKDFKERFEEYNQIFIEKVGYPILLIDHADEMLCDMPALIPVHLQHLKNWQNILLKELETFEGILICNCLDIDKVSKLFLHRFVFNIHFQMPDTKTRSYLWRNVFKELQEEEAKELAALENTTPADILNTAKRATWQAVIAKENSLNSQLMLIKKLAELVKKKKEN